MQPELVDYASNRNLARTYENQVLYQMCIDAPGHGDPAVNAGKVILIGRTYAASPQRGAGTARDSSLDFFDAMGQALQASNIDAFLADIHPQARCNHQMLAAVVETHRHLVSLLSIQSKRWAIEGHQSREQPSFASKYLHFHRPNAFPIMDGRAKEGLRRNGFRGTFVSYDSFCSAVLSFAETQSDNWTLRGLDGSLLAASR